LAIHTTGGELVHDIEFEALGTVGGGVGRWSSDELFVTFQTFHVPSTIYCCDLKTGDLEVWASAATPVDPAAYEIEQVWYGSADDTQVPMFVVTPTGFVRDGSAPTLLTGYGGFNNAMTPVFSPLATTWLESGGIFVAANLRGGGKFGEAWH
jgi:prolyl oligopeptidase